MSNTHKTHIKNDKHDKHFIEHVEKSTHTIEHDLADLDPGSKKVYDLESLLKNQKKDSDSNR